MAEWFDKLSKLILGEPDEESSHKELLRDADDFRLSSPELFRMIKGVLQVAEMDVRDVMVPRQQMVFIDRHASLEKTTEIIMHSGHSRFPVIEEGDTDEVLGLLHSKDLLPMLLKKTAFNMESCLRPMMIVPETKRLDVLLHDFRGNNRHMAVVVDEYGHVAGLVTLEDVLEQIVGDIEDEHDRENDEQDNIVEQANQVYWVNAQTPLDEFNTYFQVHIEDEEFHTIGGVLLHHLSRLPQKGETIALHGFQFTVLKSDNRRLHQLQVTRVAEAVEGEGE